MYSPIPATIGWAGSTTQSRSFSPSARHFRSQVVPISALKIFEKCAEWRTIEPHPVQDPLLDPLDHLVGDLVVVHVPPPDQDVGVGEHLLGEPVLRLVERGGLHAERRNRSRSTAASCP